MPDAVRASTAAPGYTISQREARARTQLAAYFVGAGHNLLRMAKLVAPADAAPLPEPA
jgi:hypothetical protein